MPRVKIDYIVSFSSEDPDNPASNLLCWEVCKKRWLCAKGETTCSVVLQLTKAVKISTLNIGTYNTAFVEVLVGRSEKPNEPFQVLVPSSVFLSPSESRRAGAGAGAGEGAGAERVRSFGQLGALAAQRWDRLRLVCSQPYNKHCKFGLSFIQISEPEGTDPVPTPAAADPAPVRLSPAPDSSSDEDAFRPGELFAAARSNTHDTPSSEDAGSQIRHATSQALKNISDSATKLVKTPISKHKHTASCSASGDYGTNRQRDDLLYTDDDDKPHAKIDHIVQRHKDDKVKNEAPSNKKKRKETPEKETSSKKAKHDDSNKNVDTSFKDKKDTPPHVKRKKDAEDESSSSKKPRKETHDPSKNSANDSFRKESKPVRSHSDRSKDEPSTSKNAEYNQNKASSSSGKADPKKRSRKKSERELSTVLSGVVLSLSGYVNPERSALRQLAIDMGASVRRDWSPDCNLLVCAFPNTPKLKQVRAQPGALIPIVHADWLKRAYSTRRKPHWKVFAVEPKYKEHPSAGDQSDEQTDDGDTDIEPDEECDTDDEIEKAINSAKKTPSPSPTLTPSSTPASDDGDTDRDTDSECVERIDTSRSLPLLFDGRTFLVSAGGDAAAEWGRYVRAYGGLVLQESEVDEDSVVDYVISADGNTSFKAAACVRPRWLWRCHRARRLLPAPAAAPAH